MLWYYSKFKLNISLNDSTSTKYNISSVLMKICFLNPVLICKRCDDGKWPSSLSEMTTDFMRISSRKDENFKIILSRYHKQVL